MKAVLRAIKGWVATIFWCSLIMCLSVWMAKAAFADYPFFKILLFVMAFAFVASLIAFQLEKTTRVKLFRKFGRALIFIFKLIGELNTLGLILVYTFFLLVLFPLFAAMVLYCFFELNNSSLLFITFFLILLVWLGFGKDFAKLAIKIFLHDSNKKKQLESFNKIANIILSRRNVRVAIYLFNFLFMLFYSFVELSGIDVTSIRFASYLSEEREVFLYSFLTIIAYDTLLQILKRA